MPTSDHDITPTIRNKQPELVSFAHINKNIAQRKHINVIIKYNICFIIIVVLILF